MRTCPDCGCRVYSLGCVNCNEAAYIEEQIQLDALYGPVERFEYEHNAKDEYPDDATEDA